MTREEFNNHIREVQEQSIRAWTTSKPPNEEDTFPVVGTGSMGRCRYCGKRTKNIYIAVSRSRGVIFNTVSRLLQRNNCICNLDCLYNFIIDRTPEILEEITR